MILNSHRYLASATFGEFFGSNILFLALSILIAFITGLLMFFSFLAKKNEGAFDGFLGWVYDFLNFKKLLSESLLKISYLFGAIFISISSFFNFLFGKGGNIIERFFLFLLTFLVGNVILRLIYEFALVIIIICRNTTDISKKISDKNNEYDEDTF